MHRVRRMHVDLMFTGVCVCVCGFTPDYTYPQEDNCVCMLLFNMCGAVRRSVTIPPTDYIHL